MKKIFSIFILSIITSMTFFLHAGNHEKIAIEVGFYGVNDPVSISHPNTTVAGCMVGLSFDNLIWNYGRTFDNEITIHSGYCGYNVDIFEHDTHVFSVVPFAGVCVQDLTPYHINSNVQFDYGIGIKYKVNKIAVTYKMFNKFGAGISFSFDIN